MTKILLLIALAGFVFTSALSQDSVLPLDKSGRFTFYKVVETPGLGQSALYQNALAFLGEIEVVKQKKKETYLIEEEFSASTTGGFLVYNYKSPDGEIRYNVSIEVRDNKYRYTITDFVFFPYTRNRYGKFERERWKSRALEAPVPKGEQKLWDKHLANTSEKIERLVGRLDLGMQRLPMVAEDPKSPDDSNW